MRKRVEYPYKKPKINYFCRMNKYCFHIAFAVALSLVMAGGAGSCLYAQQAKQVSRFTDDSELRQEVSLRGGVSLPLRGIKSVPGENGGLSKGAKTGGMLGLSYHFYPIPQLFIGVHVDGHLLGYDFGNLASGGADSYVHSGWNALGLAAVVGGRMPLGIYGLYFTANIGAGYGLMFSPFMNAVNKVPAPTEKNPKRTRRDVTTLLASSTVGNFYLTGGVGIEYRFKQHWIAKFMVDYSYMPSNAGWGSNQFTTASQTGDDLLLKLSVFAIGVGINYAF